LIINFDQNASQNDTEKPYKMTMFQIELLSSSKMDQKQSIQEGVKNNHNLTVNNQVALKKCSSDIKTLISNSLISNSDFKTQRNKASIL
jgi:hypothetical protein